MIILCLLNHIKKRGVINQRYNILSFIFAYVVKAVAVHFDFSKNFLPSAVFDVCGP